MNDHLRIGDADRESAARELGEHFALGRITADEHAERLDQIWAARTAAELAPAFRDLPRTPASRSQTTPRRSTTPTPSGRTRGWRPEIPHIPFPFKALVAIVVLWWGFHHLLILLVAAVVYVVFVRRFTRRRRRRGRPGPWDRGRYASGWH